MKYKEITEADAIQGYGGEMIFMLVEMTDSTTRAQIRDCLGFVVEIKDEKEPAPDPKPKKEPVSKVDHGKIVSLAQAGWNISSIALECSCSTQTVRNHLARECPNDSDD